MTKSHELNHVTVCLQLTGNVDITVARKAHLSVGKDMLNIDSFLCSTSFCSVDNLLLVHLNDPVRW